MEWVDVIYLFGGDVVLIEWCLKIGEVGWFSVEYVILLVLYGKDFLVEYFIFELILEFF